MKKILGICMSIVAILLSSCSSEEPILTNETDGNVVFTATLPQQMVMSRSSYDDGLTATNLNYAVYDADGANITALNGTGTFTDRKTTVSLSLVTGKTYTVVFWASAPDAPYTFDAATGKVTVTTTGDANDTKRDAFFAYEKFTVTGAINKTIELKRPFAQINIGTNDLEAFTAAGGTITTSGITVTAPNELNLLDGTVSGEAEYVLTPTAFVAESETFPVTATPAQRWLTTAFVLTGDAKATVDVKWTSDNTTPGRDAVDFTFVPIQRNYRTNIYGTLLTNPAEYNVIINEAFETPYYEVKVWGGEVEAVPAADAEGVVTLTTPGQLAGLAVEVANGSTYEGKTIKLDTDMDMANHLWIPIGSGDATDPTVNKIYPFKGTFDGGGHTITNLAIDNATSAKNNYYAGLFYTSQGTIKNVTIKNANVEGQRTACLVGRFDGGLIENCHIDGAVITSVQKNGGLVGYGQIVYDAVIKDCTVKNVTINPYTKAPTYQSGGVVGYLQVSSGNVTIENVQTSDITVSKAATYSFKLAYKGWLLEDSSHPFVGAICNGYLTSTGTDHRIDFKNCSVSGTNNISFFYDDLVDNPAADGPYPWAQTLFGTWVFEPYGNMIGCYPIYVDGEEVPAPDNFPTLK